MGAWNEKEVRALVTGGEREDRFQEFKAAIPNVGRPDGKKKFLAGVAAFANGMGGAIFFGIEAEDAVAKRVCGVQVESIDATVLQLEQIIHAGIEPRIPGLSVYPVHCDGATCIVMEVPQSAAAPHMLKDAEPAFYNRGAAGKVPMDVYEIRNSFLASNNLAAKLREFRTTRVRAFMLSESPEPLYNDSLAVLHVMPFASFARFMSLDIADLRTRAGNWRPPQDAGSWGPGVHLDGVLVTSTVEGKSFGYFMVMRNGCVEIVVTDILSEPPEGSPLLKEATFGACLRTSLIQTMNVYQSLEIPPPYAVGLSILNAEGACVPLKGHVSSTDRVRALGSDELLLPEQIVTTWNGDPDPVLKPSFDMIWNACGMLRSDKFDRDGKWIPKV